MEVSFTCRIILYSGKYGKYAISELICVLPGCLFFSIYANGLPHSPFYKNRAILIDNTKKFFKAIIHPLEGLNSTFHSFAMLSALELYCQMVDKEAISVRSFPEVSTCTQFWTIFPNLQIYVYVDIEIPSSSDTFVWHILGVATTLFIMSSCPWIGNDLHFMLICIVAVTPITHSSPGRLPACQKLSLEL